MNNLRTMARRLAVCCLLLCSFAGNMMAQTDKPYVIKWNDTIHPEPNLEIVPHYLSHVKTGETWVLQDATAFDSTCLWYSGPVFNVSGTHHNYYFYDEAADKYHFLSAPLAPNQDLGLSADLPTTSQLKNPDEIYYFYDWDPDQYGNGVARGHDDNGWWTVHWVSYSKHASKWLTSADHYHIVDSAARYREVTITEHDRAFNWTQDEIGNLSDFAMDYDSNPMNTEHPLSITIGNYSYTCTPAYTTYNFEGSNYNFHGDTFLGVDVTPTPSNPITGSTASSYEWKITGAAQRYLSFSSTSESNDTISNLATPKVYYTTENTQGRKTATLTLTMTFGSGENMATVVRTATITVNTQCQNPAQAAAPVINHNDVTVSWYPTAESYRLYWKKTSASVWNDSITVGNVTSYTIHDLEQQVEYQYRVIAYCDGAYLTPEDSYFTGKFTPEAAPDLMIYGSIFGGGRAANVTKKTEVVIVNCDSIGAIYGGNDIAGSAGGDDGSVITLGVGVTGTGVGNTTKPIRIGSVYGGGNGYYAYDSTTFVAATATEDSILPGQKVYALSQWNQWNDSVWINSGSTNVAKPSIQKTTITVTNDFVKIDSLFGGAKNAFVTKNQAGAGDATTTNTKTTIDGGTIFAVFGGNNVGGTLGTAKQEIDVNNTKIKLDTTKGLGRTHGIAYLFGGGNLVAGTYTDIEITGGQMDTIFGGGNRASVDSAYMMVNCVDENRITAAFTDPNYGWDGDTIYNVHTLFGGNNHAHMNGVPRINLTSGGVGTAYGGGNAGDMLAHVPQQLDDTLVNVSTHMQLASDNMIVDFLYGGCQMSNVEYCTWVEIMGGHVGTVYGGCNVSGDVGSTRTDPGAPAFDGPENNQTPNEDYQKVRGATYVKVTGGNVYRDVFAGSNGYYHCNDGVKYVAGLNYGDPDDGHPAAYDPNDLYVGVSVPTHNATNVKIQGGHIRGNVYAGGNLACVGFTDYTVPEEHTTGDKLFPTFVGLSFVEMSSGIVDGDVYGGGRMASVFGSNSVKVSGGRIGGSLYGGNDRTGQVAQITNRVLDDNMASDGYTDLNQLNVKTYVRVTDSARITTVYGGGNGDYDYTGPNHIQFCGVTPDEPIQSNTFVDIDIKGGQDATSGHIGTVYGGGNGVTVINGITVFLNVKDPDYSHDNVDVIYGGNNKGSLTLVPDIILLKGQVNTVYGGCNKGAMYGDYTFSTVTDHNDPTIPNDTTTYHNVGSLVRLRDVYKTYNKSNSNNPVLTSTTIPTAKVSGSVYGGCRMNGVTNKSMVIVEGHDNNHVGAELFGGSDISGIVGDTAMVVVNGITTTGNDLVATQIGNVYGGGNGHYDYDDTPVDVNGVNYYYVYKPGSEHTEANRVAYDTAAFERPYCAASRVDMLSGNCATGYNLYAGGYAALSGATAMNIKGGTVNDRAFGGGNLAGTTTVKGGNGSSTVTVNGGTVNGGIFGGNNLADSIAGPVNVYVYGGTLGTSTTAMADGIYGGGYGKKTGTLGNVTVTIDKANNEASAPTIYGAIYGGSALGQVNKPQGSHLTTVDFKEGTLYGTLYGGGMGSPAVGDSAVVNGGVRVDLVNGTILDGIYGGCNIRGGVTGDIDVNILGGSVGSVDSLAQGASTDVFGGGYGSMTATSGNVAVKLDTLVGTIVPVVYGDVYGGSGYGSVNSYNSGKTTTVTLLNGTIDTARYAGVLYGGNVYGGGLGDTTSLGNGHHDYPAKVYGKIYVNIGDTISDSDHLTGNATINGSVYGCNNVYGSPQDNVFVNIFKTKHINTPHDNFYPTAPSGGWNLEALYDNERTQAYALNAVYGGGNKAAYVPPAIDNVPRTTTVHVWGCRENTINDIYGGGNAANVGDTTSAGVTIPVNTCVIIDGGRIHRMFGGGNGYSSIGNHSNPSGDDYNPGANIFGTASSYVRAGLIDEVYGGANQWGSIDVIDLHLSKDSACGDEVFGSVFGCANEAPINHDISTTVECGVGEIGELYGGSNLAYIGDARNPHAVVTLTVKGGGPYENVFGGSKGDRVELGVGHHNIEAPIYGSVVLNLVGGTIVKAFGGSDQNGNITGSITVNVDTIAGNCPLVLDTLFGSGNITAYTPNKVNNNLITSPIVNVKNGVVRQAVFGAGLGRTAIVTANPQVNIGDTVTGHETKLAKVGYLDGTTIHGGDVYGGGYAGNVKGGPEVNILKSNTIIYNKVFGGGDFASIDSTLTTTVNVVDGTVKAGVYGGCHNEGNVKGAIAVNIYGGTLGTQGAPMSEGIFGGGLGQPTTTTGNVTVTVDSLAHHDSPVIYGNIYGGSALGSVNDTGPSATDNLPEHLTKVDLKKGTIHGVAYGGGLGDRANDIAASVYGNVEVYANGATIDTIFGCNDQNGAPAGTVKVTINDGIVGDVYGGGDLASYVAPTIDGTTIYSPYISMTGGQVLDMMVGGGNLANITGNTKLELTGGSVGTEDHLANIFGGGYGEGTNVNGNVLINFGEIDIDLSGEDPVESHADDLVLYGYLYGGSALGDVNTQHGNDSTTVNLLNGTIRGNGTIDGIAYGGGLGRKAETGVEAVESHVYGKVHVNIGGEMDVDGVDGDNNPIITTIPVGMADLVNCDVYGCNNLFGSPQKDVYVDVYKTKHIPDNEQDNYNGSFAIDEVFGGGNLADYSADNANNKIHLYVHYCDNTVRRLFGGGNAAYVSGVNLTIEGGRFDEVYGGGNGELGPAFAANIGDGGITIILGGGRINQLVNGSNDNGDVSGTIVSTTMTHPVCDDAEIVDYFLGNNKTDLYENIETTINCGVGVDGFEWKFVNLYCGSNVSQIYGNIKVTVNGGVFENLFGGSKGCLDDPETPEIDPVASCICIITDQIAQEHPGLTPGDGGNINLTIHGGTIGNLYGGCDVNGNVEGKITIVVDSLDSACPLFIGNIYGGANHTNYSPTRTDIVNGTVSSPEIKILKGTIGGTTTDLPIIAGHQSEFEGNVYGGGNEGDVTSNTKIILGDYANPNNSPVTIKGNVYGGGRIGTINGSTEVIIVPTNPNP